MSDDFGNNEFFDTYTSTSDFTYPPFDNGQLVDHDLWDSLGVQHTDQPFMQPYTSPDTYVQPVPVPVRQPSVPPLEPLVQQRRPIQLPQLPPQLLPQQRPRSPVQTPSPRLSPQPPVASQPGFFGEDFPQGFFDEGMVQGLQQIPSNQPRYITHTSIPGNMRLNIQPDLIPERPPVSQGEVSMTLSPDKLQIEFYDNNNEIIQGDLFLVNRDTGVMKRVSRDTINGERIPLVQNAKYSIDKKNVYVYFDVSRMYFVCVYNFGGKPKKYIPDVNMLMYNKGNKKYVASIEYMIAPGIQMTYRRKPTITRFGNAQTQPVIQPQQPVIAQSQPVIQPVIQSTRTGRRKRTRPVASSSTAAQSTTSSPQQNEFANYPSNLPLAYEDDEEARFYAGGRQVNKRRVVSIKKVRRSPVKRTLKKTLKKKLTRKPIRKPIRKLTRKPIRKLTRKPIRKPIKKPIRKPMKKRSVKKRSVNKRSVNKPMTKHSAKKPMKKRSIKKPVKAPRKK